MRIKVTALYGTVEVEYPEKQTKYYWNKLGGDHSYEGAFSLLHPEAWKEVRETLRQLKESETK